nr:MAG TPA: Poxvirus poly(A) polymerase nucleotidyltransferase domain [Caudoviricetes sp.]
MLTNIYYGDIILIETKKRRPEYVYIFYVYCCIGRNEGYL